jgi:glycosyltransferase involved in cell wall biosynthesis
LSRSNIRVAVDVTPMLGPPTGVHQTTSGLLAALRRRHDVEVSGYVLSFRGRFPEGRSRGLEVRSRRWPASLAHVCWPRTDIPSGSWLAGPHDVIHGTNYTVPPSDQGRVVTVQDLTLVTHPHWCTPAVLRMRPALERAIDHGAHVHVTSRRSGEEAVALLGVDPSRLHVIGVAITPVGPGDGDRGRALVGADDYVLALGTSEARKDLPSLVQAVARLDRRITLAVVGPAGPAEQELQRTVARAGLGDRYRRLGVVSEQQRSDLMRGAALLAYPSLAEGFGLPPLEAVTVGCPVVATEVGALPELIGDHFDLVPPGDTDALTAALEAAISAPPSIPTRLIERLGTLTWDAAADRMLDVYRRTLS